MPSAARASAASGSRLVLLVVLIILTPLSVAWSWPVGISVAFLFITLILLLFAGQTVIFLLRLVAADRREGRRRPLGSADADGGRARGRGDRGSGARCGSGDERGARGGERPAGRVRRARIAGPIHGPRRPDRSVPVLATFFSVRRGRDPFFKFFMKTIFPRQVKEYEEKFGIRFVGWYNVAHGWDFDNVILLDLPDYGTLDKPRGGRGDASARPPGRGMDLRTPPLDVPAGASRTRPRVPRLKEAIGMDVSRNDLLGEIANDAALERTDFIVQATEQLAKFLDRNRDRIAAARRADARSTTIPTTSRSRPTARSASAADTRTRTPASG